MPGTRIRSTPISLSEQDGVRYLHFGTEWIQGAMRLARPDDLELDYVQRMMSWLLFLSPPAQILQLGLGAGALTRFAHRHFMTSKTTVVECSSEVIDVARHWFELPADDARLRVVKADAGAFLQRAANREAYGVIQVDLYDASARGPVLDSAAFYRDCHRALAYPGILVVNLFGRGHGFATSLSRIERAFDGRVRAMAPVPAGNRIVLAFKGPPLNVSAGTLTQRARALSRRYGLRGIELDWLAALGVNRQHACTGWRC